MGLTLKMSLAPISIVIFLISKSKYVYIGRVNRGELPLGASCHNGSIQLIALLSRALEVFVNTNSFCLQCPVMALAALIRDRVLHYLPRQVKFYSLSFHVIDIKRILQRNKLLYYLKRYSLSEYVK